MFDAWLNIENDEERRLDELIKQREEHIYLTNLLNIDIDKIQNKNVELKEMEITESDRQQYLSENPSYLIQHREGKISSIGYNKLQKDMKFSSKQKLVEWLEVQS